MAPRDLDPAHLSDGDLLAEVTRLAACEREATAALVALLAEVEARRLHLAEGCSSLFAYCTERLHLSEHAAYHRIEAARAARAFPVILAHLRGGALTLTAVTLLRPHLTEENHGRLLAAACGRSKREVEVLVRGVAPLPEVRASVRKLAATGSTAATSPTWTPVSSTARDDARAAAPSAAAALPPAPAAPPARCGASLEVSALAGDTGVAVPSVRPASSRTAEIRVLAPERYSMRVTLSAEGHARLRRAQDLLRHTVPDGDPAVIVERALALLVEHLERTKFALRPGSGRSEQTRQDAARRRKSCAPAGRDSEAPAPSGRLERPVDPEPDMRGRSEARLAGTPAEPAANAPVKEHQARPAARAVSLKPGASRAGQRAARTIPAAVKRAVWARDEGRCTFVGTSDRCRETGRLEFHHRVPVADGGASTVDNLQILCTAHHARESERWFGEVSASDDRASIGASARTRSGPSSGDVLPAACP